MFEVCSQHLIIFQSTPKNRAVKQLKCYRIPVCIYIFPAFHHLLSSHYFSNSSDNQGKPKYYIYMHQQFYIHLSFFGKFLNKSACITIYSWRTIQYQSFHNNPISVLVIISYKSIISYFGGVHHQKLLYLTKTKGLLSFLIIIPISFFPFSHLFLTCDIGVVGFAVNLVKFLHILITVSFDDT